MEKQVAFTNVANTFAPGQRIADDSHSRDIIAASIGSVEPHGKIKALAFGELYIHEYTEHYCSRFNIYIAKKVGDADWVLISGVANTNEDIKTLNENLGQLTAEVHFSVGRLQREIDNIYIPTIPEYEDLSPAIEALKEELQAVKDSIPEPTDLSVIHETLANHETRIVTLENRESGGGDPTPPPVDGAKKYYVLPIGGQSNAVGYGETAPLSYLDDVHPSIKQISRVN